MKLLYGRKLVKKVAMHQGNAFKHVLLEVISLLYVLGNRFLVNRFYTMCVCVYIYIYILYHFEINVA